MCEGVDFLEHNTLSLLLKAVFEFQQNITSFMIMIVTF